MGREEPPHGVYNKIMQSLFEWKSCNLGVRPLSRVHSLSLHIWYSWVCTHKHVYSTQVQLNVLAHITLCSYSGACTGLSSGTPHIVLTLQFGIRGEARLYQIKRLCESFPNYNQQPNGKYTKLSFSLRTSQRHRARVREGWREV